MKNFEKYDVFKDGRVYSNLTNKFMKGTIDSTGYLKLTMRDNGKRYQVKLHRLVAHRFIPNPNNLPQVNHIDGNKLNNHVNNLEWCTISDNIRHAHATGLSTNAHLKKKVKQINPSNNEVVAVYNSYREASIKTGISEQNISQICRRYKPKNRPYPRQTAGGFKWETFND